MGDPDLDEDPTDNQPQPAEASSLPEEIVQQILRFFPVAQALRYGLASRAFSRASLASLRGASCANGVSACGACCCCCCCCCCYGSFGSGTNGNVEGTPFLDLRDGGDAVDSGALSSLLRRVFSRPEDSPSTAADGTGSNAIRSLGPSPSASSGSGTPTTLKGLALCSAAVRDEAIGHALELHGEGLEALNLAGCRSLDASLTVASVQKWCKRLATLDISGTAFEDDGRVGYIPSPVTPPGFPVGRRRRLPQDSGGIFGGRGSEFGAEGTHSLQQENVDRLEDCHLVSLLSGGLGRGLLSLRLRDRPFITDEGVGAIASCCTQLRELDVGTRRRLGQTGKITGQALDYLSAAPCAQSLVSLGLRNRHSIGHLNLRALGTQFPGLKKLDLAGLVKVDHAVLKDLAWTLSLTHIDLSRAHHVSVAGVAALALGSPELECISLHGIALADGAVRALCDACPRLRHINISMTRVTERSLRLLAAKDSLRWANVRCCCDLRDNASTLEVLAAFRTRLSARKHPRDRGTVLGMERPEPQQRARTPPPKRSPRRSLDGGSGKDQDHKTPPKGGEARACSNSGGHGVRPPVAAKHALHEGGGDGGGGGIAVYRRIAPWCSDGGRATVNGDVPSGVSSDGACAMHGNRAAAPWQGDRAGDGNEASAAGATAERCAGGPSQRTSSTPAPVPVASSVLSSGPGASEKAEREKGRGEQTTLVREGVKETKSAVGSAAASVARPTPPAQPAAAPATGAPAARTTAETPSGEAPPEVELPAPAAPAPALAPPSPTRPTAAASPAPQPPPPPPTSAVAAVPPTSSSGDRPLPLLPAGVGDLSLGQNRRRTGAQRRSPGRGRSSFRAPGKIQEKSTGAEPGDETWGSREEDGVGGRGRGVGGESNLEGGVVVPFDWDNIPRASGVGDLGGWKGFRGMSGDLVKNVIRELHPYAQVDFRAKPDTQMGPPTRKISHGYLVHTSKWGQAWVEFEVDDQGCIA